MASASVVVCKSAPRWR